MSARAGNIGLTAISLFETVVFMKGVINLRGSVVPLLYAEQICMTYVI
jgi:hypothetical protein